MGESWSDCRPLVGEEIGRAPQNLDTGIGLLLLDVGNDLRSKNNNGHQEQKISKSILIVPDQGCGCSQSESCPQEQYLDHGSTNNQRQASAGTRSAPKFRDDQWRQLEHGYNTMYINARNGIFYRILSLIPRTNSSTLSEHVLAVAAPAFLVMNCCILYIQAWYQVCQ